MRAWLALIIGLAATASSAQKADDGIDMVATAIENYRRVATANEASAIADGINICRLIVGEAGKSVHHAHEAWERYEGPGKLNLTMLCRGYIQASVDLMTLMPMQK